MVPRWLIRIIFSRRVTLQPRCQLARAERLPRERWVAFVAPARQVDAANAARLARNRSELALERWLGFGCSGFYQPAVFDA
jgi:hypothetical protein